MEQRRISMADIIVGQPLPWDVFDASNHLLLCKGHIVEHAHQVETLMERGLFIDAKALHKKEAAPVQKETTSALRLINSANKRLEHILFQLHRETDAQAKILEVVQEITLAVDTNQDVSLGCILLNQIVGSYSVRHCIDTAVVSLVIARALAKPADEIQALTAAALTMNIGMLSEQDKLHSTQEALSSDKMDFIRSHPQHGVAILKQAGIDNENWLSYVLTHHENEDGSGYPSGKKADEIPANAKIISLADRYCARVSIRNYRKSLLPNAALRDILLAEKNKIDPMLAPTFIRELGTYPIGTFVRLESGEVGVVTGKGATTTTPFVHSLLAPRGAPLSAPIKRNTALQMHAIREVLSEHQADVRFSMQQLWGAEASM